MEYAVFYAWQDSPANKVVRYFIRDSLAAAIKQLKADATLEDSPRLDHDTKGVPGAPAIADTIFKKIASCGIFVADLTLMPPAPLRLPDRALKGIGRFFASAPERRVPNPNVLLELGYAHGAIGLERTIWVMNDAFGSPKELPFDLLHRRFPITYTLAKPKDPREKETKAELVRAFVDAMRLITTTADVMAVPAKDRRLAEKVESELLKFSALFLQTFASTFGAPLGDALAQRYEVDPRNGFALGDPLENVKSAWLGANLVEQSGAVFGGTPTTWAEFLFRVLSDMWKEVNRLLDRYSDRDERLVSLLDKLDVAVGNCVKSLQYTIALHGNDSVAAASTLDLHRDAYIYLLDLFLGALQTSRAFIRQG